MWSGLKRQPKPSISLDSDLFCEQKVYGSLAFFNHILISRKFQAATICQVGGVQLRVETDKCLVVAIFPAGPGRLGAEQHEKVLPVVGDGESRADSAVAL